MNIFSFLVLLISIGLFMVSFHLFREYRKNPFHRRYTLLFLVLGLFIFVIFLISDSGSKAEAIRWTRFLAVSHFIFPFITDSLLHLFRNKVRMNVYLKNGLVYIPFLVLFFIDIINPSLTFNDPILTPYGWMYSNKGGMSLFFLHNIIYYLSILFLIFLIIYFYFEEKDIYKRRFLVFFVISLLLPFSIFLFINFLFEKGTIYVIPFLAFSGLFLFFFIIYFLQRYAIFDISLEIAWEDIVKNITNMLFLLDKETRIVEVNDFACRVLSCSADELRNTMFRDLLYSTKQGEEQSRLPAIDSEVFFKTRKRRYLPAYISISKVYRRKNFLGYMIMGNDLSKIHKLSSEKKILQLELKALQAQMNPHFIFNALNSILLLISKRDEVKANEYITCLANLIRRVMENVNKELVTIDEEIELLKSYISIESLRFDAGFSYSIEKKGISSNGIPIIPPMIIQPFVENAIWHGLLPMKEGIEKKLQIRFEKKQNQLEVSIVDNGVGRIKTQHSKPSKHKVHASQGIKNIEERIRLYNTFSDNLYIDLHIDDLTDKNNLAAGTEVRIYFDMLKK